ncbi:MAG: pyrimidine utilization protein D [Alphaproteobacteria bacterium]|nr:MAG: pyrimidine utilization protein D [Alphaproteobacteria bacterium]
MLTPEGLYYEEDGCGPPLILSAGLGGAGSYWMPNVPALAEHRRVILYDHLGTGKSAPGLQDRLTIDDMASDVLALMDSAGIERAEFMGHALGGIIGLALARRAPERLSKLIIVNGWAKADPATLRCFNARLHILNSGGPRAYLEAQPMFLFPAMWISAHDEQIARDTEVHLAHFQGEETLRKRIAALAAFDATEWLHTLKMPILALAARDDVLVPYTATVRLAGLLDETWREMDWGGHACNVTEPDIFNELILEFLGSN